MIDHSYFALCPRGYSNEIVYFRVPADKMAAVDTEFAGYNDCNTSGYALWTDSAAARAPGVAVDWSDRVYYGL